MPITGTTMLHLRFCRTQVFVAVFVVLLAATLPVRASAQSYSSAELDDKCAYQEIDIKKYGGEEFRNPPEILGKDGSLNATLNVQYTVPEATSIAGCPVTLRTYNGQLVGPTLRIKAGEVMNIMLKNNLPTETPNQVYAQYQQEATNVHLGTIPASFNTTNLHTHGLHVSPVGNSDNVLLAIAPQSSFAFEIKVPRNHPTGSFWYHPHTHGSTSIQVGSGLAGALIIEDDETEIPQALREANKHEKVMVFQTTLYSTQGRLDDITALFPDPTYEKNPHKGQLDCEKIRRQNEMTWACSKRRITINGQIVPRIKMRPGEVQRWRMIDTAFRESINVQLQGHALHEIALDGLYLGRVETWPADRAVELAPGYRSDVLVQASRTPGVYRLLDKASSKDGSLHGMDETENLLAEVIIEGDPLEMNLPTSQEMASLAPFPDVNLNKSEKLGIQRVQFEIYGDANTPTYFAVNNAEFNPNHSRQVALGATDVWQVNAVGAPHVFHIHVNPFQYQRKSPNGQSEWVWKDTLLIKQDKPAMNLYTKYSKYIGKFVMHCHILDHEDLGMMEVVEVVDQASGVARHHR